MPGLWRFGHLNQPQKTTIILAALSAPEVITLKRNENVSYVSIVVVVVVVVVVCSRHFSP